MPASFSPRRHLPWLALPLLPSLFLLLASAVSSAPIPSRPDPAVIRKEVIRTELKSIPACEQVPGLCDGERRFLMPRVDGLALRRLKAQGCKVKHELRGQTALSCPASVNLQSARSERAFRVGDLVSATRIQADKVWSEQTRGEGVRVAVLDSGADSSHPELNGRIISQADFTGTGLQDALGHGTHVAGIVAGAGEREIEANRAIGASPNVSLLVGKVCRDDGWCLESDILAGIEWAVQQKAQVMNLSLGEVHSKPIVTEMRSRTA